VAPPGTRGTAVDTFLRHHHERGLSPRRLTSDDIVVPDLLDT
jgi:4,5-dihydroxyphthalate decarboxylase